MNQLELAIKKRIHQAGGRLPFAEFMTEALYHPEWGYYNRAGMTIGEQGDFYTAPMVHPIFGECVARQIFRMWEHLGCPASFAIVEMGAGTGALAHDLLREWDRLMESQSGSQKLQRVPEVRYLIVEQSGVLQKIQKDVTADVARERIGWYQTLQEVEGYGELIGAVLSNELFDALPVHRLIRDDGMWKELYVSFVETGETRRFEETIAPLSDEKLAELLPASLSAEWETGDRWTVCPLAGHVLADMAACLRRGFLLTIDYGDRSAAAFEPFDRSREIRCYYKQTLVDDPLVRIGEQDITADVDFGYLEQVGSRLGLFTVDYMTQGEFLEKFGFLKQVEIMQRKAFLDLQADFDLQKMLTLYLPQGLGSACKVLVQAKL
ncbi:class I SAM-dependent methyltransferase [Effusibacillus dendaii]|uniref:SAM-dependent methyltransferase n=1 Tax=Effusibacillus dendaii TaxID=2743772 RepID=A0A7I8DAQ5_9BACL|nr:SAM-dependent methyltransferase [Effusibacillus dendaii]BCJ86432.1 SAM-dependent methyltransferase [Effusibacillus dendaii]